MQVAMRSTRERRASRKGRFPQKYGSDNTAANAGRITWSLAAAIERLNPCPSHVDFRRHTNFFLISRSRSPPSVRTQALRAEGYIKRARGGGGGGGGGVALPGFSRRRSPAVTRTNCRCPLPFPFLVFCPLDPPASERNRTSEGPPSVVAERVISRKRRSGTRSLTCRRDLRTQAVWITFRSYEGHRSTRSPHLKIESGPEPASCIPQRRKSAD